MASNENQQRSATIATLIRKVSEKYNLDRMDQRLGFALVPTEDIWYIQQSNGRTIDIDMNILDQLEIDTVHQCISGEDNISVIEIRPSRHHQEAETLPISGPGRRDTGLIGSANVPMTGPASQKVSPELLASLSDMVKTKITPQLTDELPNQMANKVADLVATRLGDTMIDTVAERVTHSVAERVTDNVTSLVEGRLTTAVAARVTEDFGRNLMPKINQLAVGLARLELAQGTRALQQQPKDQSAKEDKSTRKTTDPVVTVRCDQLTDESMQYRGDDRQDDTLDIDPLANSTGAQPDDLATGGNEPSYEEQDEESWDNEELSAHETQAQRDRRLRRERMPSLPTSHAERVAQRELANQAPNEIPMYQPANGPGPGQVQRRQQHQSGEFKRPRQPPMDRPRANSLGSRSNSRSYNRNERDSGSLRDDRSHHGEESTDSRRDYEKMKADMVREESFVHVPYNPDDRMAESRNVRLRATYTQMRYDELQEWEQEHAREFNEDASQQSDTPTSFNFEERAQQLTEAHEQSLRDQRDRVSLSDPLLTSLIQKQVEAAIENAKANESQSSNVSLLNQSGKLQIEVVNDQNDTSGSYKLSSHTRFDSFKDFLMTELKAKRLNYILEKDSFDDLDTEKVTQDKYKVRNILITHLEYVYHNRIMNINEPKEVFEKLKEIKRNEHTVTANTALLDLMNFKHKVDRSSAYDFIDKFDAKVRRYEGLPGAAELPQLSLKSIFYNAIKDSIPELDTADFLSNSTHGHGLDFEQLKAYFVKKLPKLKGKTSTSLVAQSRPAFRQDRRNRPQGGPSQPRQQNKREPTAGTSKREPYCSQCEVNTHWTRECREERKCFRCKGLGHMARDCTASNPSASGSTSLDRGQKRQHDSKESGFNKRSKSSGHPGTSAQSFPRPRPNQQGGQGFGNQGNQSGQRPPRNNQAKFQDGRGESHFNFDNGIEVESNSLEKFIVDSGATDHLSNTRLIFKHLDTTKTKSIICANKNPSANLKTQGSGIVEVELKDGSKIELENVLYAKDLTKNLLSLRKFVNNGLSVYMDNQIIDIYDPNSNESFLKGIYEEPFWTVELKVPDKEMLQNNKMHVLVANSDVISNYSTRSKGLNPTAQIETTDKSNLEGDSAPPEIDSHSNDTNINEITTESSETQTKDVQLNQGLLWHIRLGHVGFEKIRQLKVVYPELKDLQLKDLEKIIKECEVCKIAKMNKLPFQNNRTRATERLQVVHADIMGPITPASHPKGYRFVVIFVDNFTKYAMSYPLKHKSEAADALDKFIKECNNMYGSDLKFCYLDCDQGTEFTGSATIKILDKYGAELRTVCPATPQLNGSSERFNQTIQKRTRAYMFDSRLPSNAWHLALGAATYAYNLTPHRSIGMNSPLCKFKPEIRTNITRVKRFGCIAFVKLNDKPDTKFGPLSVKTVLVGYSNTGYLLLCPEKGNIVESRNVEFIERRVYGDVYSKDSIKDWEVTNVEINKKTWLLKDNAISTPEGVQSSTSEGAVPEPAKKRGRGRPPKGAITLFSLDEDNEPYQLDCDIEFHALLASIQGDPRNFREAMTRPDRPGWERAILNEREAFRVNNVSEDVLRPVKDCKGRKPTIIDSRWIFKTKVNDLGHEEKKARLVIRGFKDRNDYELRETYAPVSRLPLVRTFLVLVNKMGLILWQLDVKTAFLHSEINTEIFMEIPDGFDYSEEDRLKYVWRLLKSLYGLRTSPKSWNDHFTKVAEKIGLKRSLHDPCVFIYIDGDTIIIVIIYVDDMLMAGNNKRKMEEFRNKFAQELNMKFLGEPKEFLGISITRDINNQVMTLNQTKFIEKMLNRFGYRDIKPMNIPMAVKESRSKERKIREGEQPTASALDVRRYREIVGSFLYLVNVYRSDLAYAVNVLSRHQLNPTENEWKMAERLFRYTQYSKEYSLVYRGLSDDLEAYSDSSFCDCNKSLTTCGYVVRLFGDTVAWRTHKQTSVSLSTCQAEYIAMSDACRELMSTYISLRDMTITINLPMNMWCDNEAAVASTQKDGGEKLRHIPYKEAHYIKETVDDGWVKVKWVRSDQQLADIFTKALPFASHSEITRQIFNV